jgi:transposase
MLTDRPLAETAAIRTQFGAIFVSLELSRSTWLMTSLSPATGEKMSRREMKASDVSGLIGRLTELQRKALARTGANLPVVIVQEAGLDGFWLHRALEREGCESHVVDPGSIAAPRRRRRPKTDRIDGETQLARPFGLQARGAAGLLDGAAADGRGGR